MNNPSPTPLFASGPSESFFCARVLLVSSTQSQEYDLSNLIFEIISHFCMSRKFGNVSLISVIKVIAGI